MLMNDPGTILDARESGRVQRFHTRPMIHRDTVATHSWNSYNLLMWITDGTASKDLITYVLSHDMGEHSVGDIPSPVKKALPESALKVLADAEHKALLKLAPWMEYVELKSWEYALANVVDCIEGILTALGECDIGNVSVMLPIAKTYYKYLNNIDISNMPEDYVVKIVGLTRAAKEACEHE